MSKAAKIWATGIKRSTTVMEAQSPLTSARIEATIPPIQPQRATFQTPIADARNSTPPIRPIAPMMDRRRTFEPGSLGYKPSDGISEAPANADRIPKTIDTIDATLTSTGLAKRTRPHSEMTSWTNTLPSLKIRGEDGQDLFRIHARKNPTRFIVHAPVPERRS